MQVFFLLFHKLFNVLTFFWQWADLFLFDPPHGFLGSHCALTIKRFEPQRLLFLCHDFLTWTVDICRTSLFFRFDLDNSLHWLTTKKIKDFFHYELSCLVNVHDINVFHVVVYELFDSTHNRFWQFKALYIWKHWINLSLVSTLDLQPFLSPYLLLFFKLIVLVHILLAIAKHF